VLDIRRQLVDVAAVMASAVESSRPLITQNAHQLTLQLPPTPLALHADPVRLSQVFINLLTNAAKYTAAGGQIEFIAERQGSEAVILVRDNGAGIAAEMQDKIFDLFTQVDRRLEQRSGGLGIGLTLARRLVEIHDGSIEVRSQGINQGSEFIVRLPLLIAPPPEVKSADPAAPAKSLTGHRILMVDDNHDAANSLATILRHKGNEVRTVYDGRQAVEAAREFRPELMLVDIGLPKLNGYEVALRIRQQTWGRNMILVALTGWTQDEDRDRSRQAGFDFHMVQPVTLDALEELLSGVM
jgi:CheY-like chemotaxis protein